MRKIELKLLVDVILLAAASLTFASGLVLLVSFHMDGGPFRASALGLSRLAWQNLHRLPALATTAGVAFHAALNGRALLGWLRRTFGRERRPGAILELVLYVTFATSVVTGLLAWFGVAGAAPLDGPVAPVRLMGLRHHLVDVHHLTGLAASILAAHHLGHRWRTLARGLASWGDRLTRA